MLAVSATPPGGDDPSTYVVAQHGHRRGRPDLGAISVNATGQGCVVTQVATSWAAAEVSGVVALLRERFPRETPGSWSPGCRPRPRAAACTEGPATAAREPVDRGGRRPGARRADAPDQARSAGQGRGDGRARRADAQAPPATARIDLFGAPRAILLWSGLGAGALLALAFMLRPLIRR